MGTAEKGYSSLGKGLRPSKKPEMADYPATTAQIEQEKAAVESGAGKGAEPLRGTKVAQVKPFTKK